MYNDNIIFIVKGEIKENVSGYRRDRNTQKVMITYDEKKEYQYTYDDVQILDRYKTIDIEIPFL